MERVSSHCIAPPETTEFQEDSGPRLAFPWAVDAVNTLVTRKDARKFLGVSMKTITRYQERGVLHPIRNKVNGRILYHEAEVLAILGGKLNKKRHNLLYCRVASFHGSIANKFKSGPVRLAEQVSRLSDYCVRAGIRVDGVYKDIGPGNGSRKLAGLDMLIEKVLKHEVAMVVVETSDRIARWGMGEVFERFLAWHGVKLYVVSPVLTREEFKEEIKEDLSEVLLEAKRLLGELVDSQSSR